jgi:hypothetical protein
MSSASEITLLATKLASMLVISGALITTLPPATAETAMAATTTTVVAVLCFMPGALLFGVKTCSAL